MRNLHKIQSTHNLTLEQIFNMWHHYRKGRGYTHFKLIAGVRSYEFGLYSKDIMKMAVDSRSEFVEGCSIDHLHDDSDVRFDGPVPEDFLSRVTYIK